MTTTVKRLVALTLCGCMMMFSAVGCSSQSTTTTDDKIALKEESTAETVEPADPAEPDLKEEKVEKAGIVQLGGIDIPFGYTYENTDSTTKETTEETTPEECANVHIVQPGESLYSIAGLYGLKAWQLQEYNGLGDDAVIVPEQVLYIPKTSADEGGSNWSDSNTDVPVETPEDGANVHIVQPGESLYSIAGLYGLTVRQLTEYNGIDDDDVIIPNQVLAIPEVSYEVSSTEESTWNGIPSKTYIVQPGDSLSSIATIYGLTVQQLTEYNGIDVYDVIVPDQVLSIPEVSYEVSGSGESNWGGNNWSSDGMVWGTTINLYSTNSSWSSWHNISRAAEMLNGFKLGPGESFNWFYDMGPCSYEDGFVDGGAYVPGGSAPGGGICMVSTGLMQCARGSGCVITEKYDHSKPVSYAQPGDEAAVSYGSCNLRFYNPSSDTGLQFWVTADSSTGTLTVSTNTY